MRSTRPGAVTIFGLAMLCWLTSLPATAATTILVMAEDASPATVARNQQLSQKILSGVAAGLNELGYAVYDEEVITYENYAQGRSRRSNEELIDIAASVQQPKIDVVVFVVVQERLHSGKYFDQAGVSLSARIIDVHSGRVLGAVEQQPAPWSLPVGCLENEADCARNALNQTPVQWGKAFSAVLKPWI